MDGREWITSESPYEPVYGYSRAVRTGDRVHVGGTAPIWADGSCPDDPRVQTMRCIDIIEQALAELGGSLADVVRTRMFITRPEDHEAVGRAHGERFADIRPVTSMLVVAALIDPRWRVEIEADAVLGSR
jgi:enamine deaminase RidA (YjgF/YER057c/UK114 family)